MIYFAIAVAAMFSLDKGRGAQEEQIRGISSVYLMMPNFLVYI